MSSLDPAEASPRLYGADASERELRGAFVSGSIPVAVYGLGHVGLPLAAVFAEVTGDVTGVDVDPSVVEAVRRDASPIDEPGLANLLGTLPDGALTATTDPRSVDASLHVVVVPTTVDDAREPDLSTLEAAIRDVGETLSRGDLVVVESTVPPGTCAGNVAAVLRETSGLDEGTFGVAHCPERTSSGRALRDIRGAYPRIVGGIDPASTRAARLVYDELTANDVVAAPDARTAECVKLFEGVYRDVNIGLANELAKLAGDLGVDVFEAIDLANTQPFCDLHEPGPGVGGHCIPYYPHFLTAAVGDQAPVIRGARAVNESMPAYTAGVLARTLEEGGITTEGASVLLLGLTYRPGVAVTHESPARYLAELLSELGADVYGADPLLDSAAEFPLEFVPTEDVSALSADLDAAVLVTPHDEFELLDWDALAPLVVLDGRNALDLGDTHHRVITLGDGSNAAPEAGVRRDGSEPVVTDSDSSPGQGTGGNTAGE